MHIRMFKRGERVSVPYGLESRVIARIESGPHRYTSEELEMNKQVNEYHGYSTKRMPRRYYLLKWSGTELAIAVTYIRPLSKPRH